MWHVLTFIPSSGTQTALLKTKVDCCSLSVCDEVIANIYLHPTTKNSSTATGIYIRCPPIIVPGLYLHALGRSGQSLLCAARKWCWRKVVKGMNYQVLFVVLAGTSTYWCSAHFISGPARLQLAVTARDKIITHIFVRQNVTTNHWTLPGRYRVLLPALTTYTCTGHSITPPLSNILSAPGSLTWVLFLRFIIITITTQSYVLQNGQPTLTELDLFHSTAAFGVLSFTRNFILSGSNKN